MLISPKFAKMVARLVDDVNIQLRKEFIKKNWGYPLIPQICGISTTMKATSFQGFTLLSRWRLSHLERGVDPGNEVAVKGSGCGRFVRLPLFIRSDLVGRSHRCSTRVSLRNRNLLSLRAVLDRDLSESLCDVTFIQLAGRPKE